MIRKPAVSRWWKTCTLLLGALSVTSCTGSSADVHPDPTASGSQVPNLIGMSIDDVAAPLEEQSLIFGRVRARVDAETPLLTVIDQNPEAGAVTHAGSRVALIISAGPNPSGRRLAVSSCYLTSDACFAGSIKFIPIIGR
jgi:hypothetical protein